MNYKAVRDGAGFYDVYASNKHLGLISRDDDGARAHHLYDLDAQAFMEHYFTDVFMNRPIKKSAAMVAGLILFHRFGRLKAVQFTRNLWERFMPLVGEDSGYVEIVRISDAELLAEIIEANAKPSPVR